MRARLGGDAGQAFAELALAVPLLLFGMLGAVDFARAYAVQQTVQNAARAAAEAYAIGAVSASQVPARAVAEMSNTPGLNTSAASVTVTFPTIGGISYVQVEVRYTFRSVVPWPLIPNSADLDRTALMRLYQ